MKTIRIDFRDAPSGELLLSARRPRAELPDRIEAGAKIELDASRWHVERVEPLKSDDAPAGIELWIRRDEGCAPAPAVRDPALFEAPSAYAPPALGAIADPGAAYLELYAEDWRQNEIVALKALGAVRADLERADREPSTTIVGPHAAPLAREVGALDRLAPLWNASFFDGVSLQQGDVLRAVEGGWALESAAGTCWYGAERAGRVVCWAIHDWDSIEGLQRDLVIFGRALGAERAALISWEARTVAQLDALFARSGAAQRAS